MGVTKVDSFLDSLGHPQRATIDALRALILASDPGLVEGLKWNAPSYSLNSNDILTFNFRNYATVALIFHTGPKGKDTHSGERVLPELSQDVVWLADRRFVLQVPGDDFLSLRSPFIQDTVRQWTNLARQGFGLGSPAQE